MTRLITTSYPETNPSRLAEYSESLRRNLACAQIDEVCVLAEGDGPVLPDSPKLQVRRITRRPLYADYFAWIEELAKPQDVSVIANSDIYFDSQLGVFKVWKLPERTVMTLTRWETYEKGPPFLFDRNNSQDAWICRGVVRDVRGDVPIGVPRCNNRILSEFVEAGYRVINPSFSICCYHMHDGGGFDYTGPVLKHHIGPPYHYVWPHNLWSLPRTVWHNLFHRKCQVGWRMDWRWASRTLPARTFQRILRACR